MYYPAGGTTYTLGTSIGSFDTTILLSSFTEPVTGTPYTISNLNTDIVYATISPKTTSSEFVSFTGITQNGNGTATLTGVIRGLAKKYPFTEDTAYKLPHAGQSQFIMSDAPQVFQEYIPLNNDVTVGGIKTFTLSPIVPNPASGTQVANKDYVDNSIATGSSLASTTVLGISRLSASPNVTKGTCTITIASPAVVTFNSHGLTANDVVQFTTTGALPTGITASTNYYVISTGLTTNTFEISATIGGSAINTSGTQSGTQTLVKTTPVVVGVNDTRLPPVSGTSGGIVGYTSTSTVASSVLLTQHALVIGGGAGATPTPLASLGTTTTVLHGNASGDPTYGAVALTTDITGVLPIANGGTGSSTNNQNFTLINTITMSAVSVTTGTGIVVANFTSLNGNTDDIYMLIIEAIATGASPNPGFQLRFNTDTGANYAITYGTLAGTYSGTNTSGNNLMSIISQSSTSIFSNLLIRANQTYLSNVWVNIDSNIGAGNGITKGVGTWNSSAANVTSIQLVYTQSSGSTVTVSGLASLYKIVR